MPVNKHPLGGFRAYKQINGTVHQRYSFDEKVALIIQADLDEKSKVYKSLQSANLFSQCGRLVGLRIRTYKKTGKLTFQLQVTVNGKQKKTEYLYKGSFESTWNIFFKLWREHFGLSVIDGIHYKEQIIKAKRLYMQDTFNLEMTN